VPAAEPRKGGLDGAFNQNATARAIKVYVLHLDQQLVKSAAPKQDCFNHA